MTPTLPAVAVADCDSSDPAPYHAAATFPVNAEVRLCFFWAFHNSPPTDNTALSQQQAWRQLDPCTILITGVAGFIGSHSAHRILQELPHATVVGIDNLSPFYDVSLKHERVASLLRSTPRFHFHRADIADPVAVPRILAAAAPSPTVVLHFAAQPNVRFCESHPAESYRANVTVYEAFLAHLTAAAGQLVHLVVASSSTVYGDVAAATQQPCNEASTPPRPASEYARQKLRVEQLSAAIATAITSKTVDAVAVSVLRFFSVYGPAGRPDMAPAAFAARVEAGAHVQVFGDALAHSRDFTFVEDAVDAVVRVVLAARPPSLSGSGYTLGPPPPLTVWNVGTGRETAVGEVLARIEGLLGRPARVRQLPSATAGGCDLSRTWADAGKVRALGAAMATPVATGL
ncbi:hypothetical protein DFJ73DRAFT_631135, partial [Zopfochytrium polystomum]